MVLVPLVRLVRLELPGSSPKGLEPLGLLAPKVRPREERQVLQAQRVPESLLQVRPGPKGPLAQLEPLLVRLPQPA